MHGISGVDWQVVYGAIDTIHRRYGDCIVCVTLWGSELTPVSVYIEYRDKFVRRSQFCVVTKGKAEWR